MLSDVTTNLAERRSELQQARILQAQDSEWGNVAMNGAQSLNLSLGHGISKSMPFGMGHQVCNVFSNVAGFRQSLNLTVTQRMPTYEKTPSGSRSGANQRAVLLGDREEVPFDLLPCLFSVCSARLASPQLSSPAGSIAPHWAPHRINIVNLESPSLLLRTH